METYRSPVGHLKFWACYSKVFTSQSAFGQACFCSLVLLHPGAKALDCVFGRELMVPVRGPTLNGNHWPEDPETTLGNAGDVFSAFFGNATIELTSNLLVRCVYQSLVEAFQTLHFTFDLSLSYLSSWTSQCQVATSACRSLMSFMVLKRT